MDPFGIPKPVGRFSDLDANARVLHFAHSAPQPDSVQQHRVNLLPFQERGKFLPRRRYDRARPVAGESRRKQQRREERNGHISAHRRPHQTQLYAGLPNRRYSQFTLSSYTP